MAICAYQTPCPRYSPNGDGVCHLAGLTNVRESRTAPLDYWRTNVGGTLTLLDGLTSARTGRIVLASTCTVYGEQATPINETAHIGPSSPYATCKLAADHAAADLAAAGVIGAISLRAFNVAGALPGHVDRDTTRLIPKVLAVQQGRASELDGMGGPGWDFATCERGLPGGNGEVVPVLVDFQAAVPRLSPAVR
jgi:UDP-glucose 4-epimerase